MKTSAETIKAYLSSIDDEIGSVIRYHKSAKSELVPFASHISASKAELSWVVAQVFIEIIDLLDNNLDSLNKMQSILFSVRVRVSLLSIVQIFSKTGSETPNLEYFSWLLGKVISNLEEALDEIRSSLISPMLQRDSQATQQFVLFLKKSIDYIENSLETAENIKEFLSKINVAHEKKTLSPFAELENTIYEALLEIVPSAAITYKQALMDLADGNRVSYRGVASEFRETLRETLDYLAPENLVIAQPNFEFENGKTNSTMKQKVRYILKSRGSVNNALKTPEEAIEIIEQRIASFTRATYERSSISTHSASERNEVQQIKHYTNAILAELLKVSFDNRVSNK